MQKHDRPREECELYNEGGRTRVCPDQSRLQRAYSTGAVWLEVRLEEGESCLWVYRMTKYVDS